MIIYIHGFGSSGKGMKASLIREYFADKDEKFIAPSLSHVPALALDTLTQLIDTCQNEEIKLIGSSLGGYYAMILAEKYNFKAILINPSTKPYVTLKKVLGHAPSFYDESYFAWQEDHIVYLESVKPSIGDSSKYLLLVQTGDELLDYKEAVALLPDARHEIIEGGDHSFFGIEKYFELINDF